MSLGSFPSYWRKACRVSLKSVAPGKIIHLNSRASPLAIGCGSDILYQRQRLWTAGKDGEVGRRGLESSRVWDSEGQMGPPVFSGDLSIVQ